jgi:photosystem II stability/assembly factor-like uncharacterized protein
MQRIVIALFLLSITIHSNGSDVAGKWIKVNPALTPQTLQCSFFINPAVGWAGGQNGAMVHTTDSGNTWEAQSMPRNSYITSIYFHDANEGWAVGQYGAFYTTNGGKEWQVRNIQNDSMINGYKIFFLNRNLGWLAFENSGRLEKVVSTRDGGKTWSDCCSPLDSVYICDIDFFNDSLGFMCGEWSIARTQDGGKTWQSVDTTSFGDISIFTVQMADARTGYGLGLHGMAKTIDAGKTWKKILSVHNGGALLTMHFSCPDTGMIFEGEFNPVCLFKTNDGGATWKFSPVRSMQESILSMSFPERNKGIGITRNGSIYRILNMGDSLFELTKGTGIELERIDFCDSLHGYAGAGNNYPQDSALLYTNNGGNTWKKLAAPITTIQQLLCFDSNTVIIYNQDTAPHFLRSEDGGQTWINMSDFGYLRLLKKINTFPDAAYLQGEANRCFMTFDAGKSWKNKGAILIDTINGTTFYATADLFFLNADTGWSLSYTSVGFSPDGGSTWKTIYQPKNTWNFSIQDIFFSSPSAGWIVGYGINTYEPFIYHTGDGGKSWQRQNNITFLTNYTYRPDDIIRHSFTKIHACDGNRAWILDERSGVLHTIDGGEHWVQDTIPMSPCQYFTDLAYNANSNTLWLTSEFYGIWKYEIPATIAIRNVPLQKSFNTPQSIIDRTNGVLIPPNSFSDAITIEVFNVSGRLVYSKSFQKFQAAKGFFISLKTLPSGYYLGRVGYHKEKAATAWTFFCANVMR